MLLSDATLVAGIGLCSAVRSAGKRDGRAPALGAPRHDGLLVTFDAIRAYRHHLRRDLRPASIL
jgi:hypothetical protein